ncbi:MULTISPECIES: MarR family winged helix-turn-helix transcriptional regulator [Photorhabdus]|uniref:MarR family transcriptional regulator n=2 Tax=Photorhabdus TaxID=29487 RepID=A0A0A0CW48_9GAMM|nr:MULTISPECIES: MarR family transcriptional regulator [Photorhabdus]KGM29828.1 MarR family transcriptional regulator [Photorhabdus luminescens]MBS9427160.1 MarR family transcriptional regulator [Photorhabdus akhurstii]OCA52945.1 Organic hydroperoxide resistance transcriptional regulator [Photorhabdus namnaonensis]PQQ26443.1 MarR family transcriptional regulator [Photorhabdus hindustanensis]PQQ36529.1 MarR family transcriptional regulator [Photorhabdus luminescens]
MSKNSILGGQLCFTLYSVTNALIRQYRPLLKEIDLTYPQFIVLLALYDQDNILLRELSEKTLFDSGTLTPLVQKLEAKRFLNRVSVAGDERMKKVVLTEKAMAQKELITALPNQIRCIMRMKDEELEMLRQLARNLLEDL